MTVDNATKYLSEWFVRFMKNKDIPMRKIEEITPNEDRVSIKQKDGKVIGYRVVPFPQDIEKSIQEITEENKGMVIYNTKENFDRLLAAWKKISQTKGLTIYFINPFSKTDKKWAVNPYTHTLISDQASLKQGLSSMYMTVDPTTPEEIEKLTK